MRSLHWILGGAVGGAVGAAIWAAVTALSNREIGWIAWLVGLLAGLGVRLAARESTGWAPGLLAAVIAVASVAAGKYFAVHFAIENAFRAASASGGEVNDELATSSIADRVVEEFQQNGKPVVWPLGSKLETASKAADYPKDVWSEAAKRYFAMPQVERESLKQELTAHRQELLGAMKARIRESAFRDSFGPFDLLWFGLVVFTAFKLGSGLVSSGDD
jgi:hypothetical protein